MSDLIRFRDYCRRQAQGCVNVVTATGYEERALWHMLADEVDAYLTGDPDVVRLPGSEDVQLPL